MKLLVFGAEKWCGPCRAMRPIIDQYIKDHPGIEDRVEFLDVDQDAARERVVGYGIYSIPALIVIRDEDEFSPEVKRSIGGLDATKLAEFLEGVL